METWKLIDAYPDYEVSSEGRVRLLVAKNNRPAGHFMRLTNGRYMRVGLSHQGVRQTFSVHRLVCLAFHGPAPSPNHEVAHLDGNAHNNTVGNLAWETKKANQGHRVRHGTHSRGERHWASRLTEEKVRAIRLRSTETGASLAREYGVTEAAISAIRKNKLWRHVQ